eukprot:scaffold8358_cov102-Isochrysis_galbana.AAC.4
MAGAIGGDTSPRSQENKLRPVRPTLFRAPELIPPAQVQHVVRKPKEAHATDGQQAAQVFGQEKAVRSLPRHARPGVQPAPNGACGGCPGGRQRREAGTADVVKSEGDEAKHADQVCCATDGSHGLGDDRALEGDERGGEVGREWGIRACACARAVSGV